SSFKIGGLNPRSIRRFEIVKKVYKLKNTRNSLLNHAGKTTSINSCINPLHYRVIQEYQSLKKHYDFSKLK
ncbi:MAG: hypothetical protein ACXU9X_04095, partial [Thermodesulfobacteriota bacterium]